MGLEVQVLAADRTEPRAVGPAENLLRQRERDRITRPTMHVELVVREIGRSQLVAALGVRGLILACIDRELDDRVGKAAIARAVQPGIEAQLEECAGAGPPDDELGGHRVRNGQVPLPAVRESAELELDLVAELLAGAEPDAPQVERLHGSSVAPERSSRSSGVRA